MQHLRDVLQDLQRTLCYLWRQEVSELNDAIVLIQQLFQVIMRKLLGDLLEGICPGQKVAQ